jgi:hypothetical protein
LDIQYISSIGFGATTWWISDDDTHNQQEPFLAYMVLLSNTTDTPWVHSISYADLEWSQNTAYTQRVDTEMAKAGLRGKLGIFFHGSMVFFRQQFPKIPLLPSDNITCFIFFSWFFLTKQASPSWWPPVTTAPGAARAATSLWWSGPAAVPT